MTESDPWHNPSEDFPPSRPGRMVVLGAALACGLGVIVVNWPAISLFAHVTEIKTALGF
jgi:hypothetical protein